jgi:hypothetical protein
MLGVAVIVVLLVGTESPVKRQPLFRGRAGCEDGLREINTSTRRVCMAALTDADRVVMGLVWLAALLVWRDVPSYLAELGDERDGAS